MNRTDFQQLAEARLEDAQVLFRMSWKSILTFLGKLLGAAGLRDIFEALFRGDVQLGANWGIVARWSQESRYELQGEEDATALLSVITDARHGGIAMYKSILVDRLIEDGGRFLTALEREKFPITGALWRHIEDDVWKVVIVSTAVDEGPLRAYVKIMGVLNGLGDSTQLSVDDIVAVRRSSAEFLELQRAIEGPLRGGIHGPGLSLQDAVFGDSYIYRWQAA